MYAAGAPLSDSEVPESVRARRAAREQDKTPRHSARRAGSGRAGTGRSRQKPSAASKTGTAAAVVSTGMAASGKTAGTMTTAGPTVADAPSVTGGKGAALGAASALASGQGGAVSRGVGVGKDMAVSKLDSMGVKGAGAVLERPTSVKAWGAAAGRSTVALSLSMFVTPVVASQIEEVLHTLGYKRIAIGAALVVAVSLWVNLMIILVVVALVASVASVPAQLVDSVVDFFFGSDPKTVIECAVVEPLPARPEGYPLGYREEQPSVLAPPTESGTPVTSYPRLAPQAPVIDGHPETAPPGSEPIPEDPATWATLAPTYTPQPSAAPTPATESEAPGDAPVDAPAPGATGYTPPKSIGEDGKPTPEVIALMRTVPKGADPRQAEAWMLYALAHPTDDPMRGWNDFAAAFARQLDALRGDGDAQESASALDIVRGIDITPYYEAHTLAAAVSVLDLHRHQVVRMTADQESNLYTRVLSGCGFRQVQD